MSYQEMNYESNNYKEEAQFYPHISGQIGQKVYPRTRSREKGLRIQLWTAFISIGIAMLMSFVLGGHGWNTGPYINDISIAPYWVCLLAVYLAIIAVNIFVARRYRRESK